MSETADEQGSSLSKEAITVAVVSEPIKEAFGTFKEYFSILKSEGRKPEETYSSL